MGRGPWMVWAFAFSVLTIFPLSFVAAAWDFAEAEIAHLECKFPPLGAWLLSWLFAGLPFESDTGVRKKAKRM